MRDKVIFFAHYFAAIVLLFLSVGLPAVEPDWTAYNQILSQYVKPAKHAGVELTWVDYSRLKKDPGFGKVVEQIEKFSPDQLISNAEKLAFYINAYNILAIKTVLDHWPVESIKDAGSFIYPVWYREAGKIGGKTITLNALEHDILRPMGEPRIHFAIVCASVSCPDLRREAFTASMLERQLDEQAKTFLINSAKGLYVEAGDVHVSQIFEWFGGDFKKRGGVVNFLRSYTRLPEKVVIKTDIPYNWSVNGE